MEFLTDPALWAAFLSLTALEIVLGIDNVVFIALLAGHLPEEQQKKARTIGLSLALLMRIGMLFAIAWIITLKEPLFAVFGHGVSGKDIMMLAGGLFLIAKGTSGIHDEVTHEIKNAKKAYQGAMSAVILQIVITDMVFSFDSVMTAVGLTPVIGVIIAAMTIAMLVMLIMAEKITSFITKYPTLKMLALSFIILVGVFLTADGLGFHVPKGYIYFAMGFSLAVETFNILARKKRAAKAVRKQAGG